MMIKKKILLAALPLLLLAAQLCTSTANAATPEPTGLVLVSTEENVAANRLHTGFVIDDQGHIIARIRSPDRELYVKDIAGATYRAQAVAYDALSRLSLLKITTDATNLKPYLFARDPAEAQRKVFGIFVPRDHVLAASRIAIGTLATVRQPDVLGSRSGYYLHNAVVGKAGLGGPLFNNCGEVVGFITSPPRNLARLSMLIKKDKSAAYAVPMEWLLSEFSAHNPRPQRAAEVCLSESAQSQSELEQERQRAAKAAAQTAAAQTELDETKRQLEEAQGASETERERLQAEIEARENAIATARERESAVQTEHEADLDAARERETQYLIWGLAGGGALLFLLLLVWILKRRAVTRERREKATAQSRAAEAQAGLAARDEEEARIRATPSVFLEGRDDAGQSFALRIPGVSIAAKDGAVVGRSPTDSDFVINHPEVSRKQFRLFSDGRLLMITDLGSTNGTHVDGKHLGAGEETLLADRSRVEISHLQLSARFQQE